MACGCELPTFDEAMPQAFGAQLWHIIEEYELKDVFERVDPWGAGSAGTHFSMRPRGYDRADRPRSTGAPSRVVSDEEGLSDH